MYEKRCFSCGKELEPVFEDLNFHSPTYGGIYFTSVGNFGSTVFDCGQHYEKYLEIYVCDECLVGKSHKIYHVQKSQIEQGEFIINKFIDVR